MKVNLIIYSSLIAIVITRSFDNFRVMGDYGNDTIYYDYTVGIKSGAPDPLRKEIDQRKAVTSTHKLIRNLCICVGI